jgi:3-hydroxyisobutyrate dehydrogenase-like beta-hydroxyacid dehydrogenase
MKMFINLLLGLMMEGFAEALNFGKLGGLDLEPMLDVVSSGAMNAPIFQVKAANLRARNHPPAFPLKHLTKDAKFIVDTAYDLGAPVPAGQVLLHLYRIGVAHGWGDEDISAIAKVFDLLSSRG